MSNSESLKRRNLTWVRRKTKVIKQINHVQICYKRGSGEDLAWTTRPTILTGLVFLPSCLIQLPIHSFSGGNYKNSWRTLLKGSQLVRFTLPFYLDWGRDIVSGLVNDDNLYEWEILIIGWVLKFIFCSLRLWSLCCMQTTWYRLVRFDDFVLQSTSFTPFL